IMRDIDYWEKIHQKSAFLLCMSIVFADDNLRQIFEPKASSIDERFKTLQEFKARGMHVGILMMPVIPLIGDGDDNITKIIERAQKIGVDFILPSSTTLREGIQKDSFLELIKNNFNNHYKDMLYLYSNNTKSGNPILSYRENFYARLKKIFSNTKINTVVPHYTYKNCYPLYDELFLLLNDMECFYEARDVNTKPLKYSISRYEEWLLEEKSKFNRKRNLDYRYLEDLFLENISDHNIDQII
ncbi:MAG: hypothetical protein HQK49_22310, partial [Oligoflexia bacterium]|nr:hypothetical protein [Oligoflexia bacterium]